MADIARIALELDSTSLKRGVAEARRLLEDLAGAGERAGKGVGAAGKSAAKSGDDFEKGAREIMQYAQALARLELAEGNHARAIDILTGSLKHLTAGSLEYLRVQTQIVQIQNQARRAAEGTDFEGLAKNVKNAEKSLGSLGDKFRGLQALGNIPGLGGLGRIAGDAAGAADALGAAGKAAGSFGIALGVTGGIVAGTAVGMVALAKNAADYSKQIADAARATGLTTSNLQAFAIAGRTVGADFKDVVDIVNQFSTQLGDARAGNKELQAVFKAVGIDAKTFGGSINEALDIALKGLSKLPPGIQKTILASRQFGEEGARQILSMKGLENGLTGLTAKYDELGNIISEEAIAEGERFNRNLTQTQLLLESISRTIGNAVLPAINDLTESYRKFFTAIDLRDPQAAGRAIGQSFLNLGAQFAGRSIADNQQYGPPTPPGFFGGAGGLRPPPGAAAKAAKIPELSDIARFRLDVLGEQAELAGKDLAELRKALAESHANSYKLSQALEIFAATGQQKTKEFAKAQDDLTKETAKLAAIMAQLKLPAIGFDRAALFGAIPGPLPVGGPASRADLFRSIPATEIPGIGGVTQSMERAAKALEIVAEQRGGLRQEFFGRRSVDEGGFARREEGVSDVLIKDFIRGIASGREGVREAAANTVQSFADFLADFSARKINDILQKQLESTFDSLFDFLGGVLGKLFNKIKSKFFDPLGDFLGGLFSSFGGFRAGGGDIGPGRFYVVGEKGPELFASKSAGTIYPNGAVMAGSGGGGPVNVTVNFSGVQNIQDFRRNENEIRRQLAAGVEQGNRMRGAR